VSVAGTLLGTMLSAHLDYATGHGVPDDRMTGQLADDEQTPEVCGSARNSRSSSR
jgi:hypothetical protein